LQGIAGYFQKIRKKRYQNRLKETEMNSANIELFSNKIQTASKSKDKTTKAWNYILFSAIPHN